MTIHDNIIAKRDMDVRKQRGERARFICFMLDALKKQHSWCGMLHVQKAYYLAQSMLEVEHEYEFIRYKYGPYCFDLANDVHSACIKCLLNDVAVHRDYGVSYELSDAVQADVDAKKGKYLHIEKINFIANWFGSKPALELEKLTSVHMVMNHLGPSATEKEQIKELRSWKPRFTVDEIKTAIEVVKAKQQEATELLK